MTVPEVPVDAYAADLAQMIADALTVVLPYAAAMTAFIVGLQMLKRWLGHRKATSLGGGAFRDDPELGISHARRVEGMPGYMNRHNRKRQNQWGHD